MDYLGKGQILTNRDVNKFVHNIFEKNVFCSMENFWDLLFQFMKHGTNTLHAAFIFLFSVDMDTQMLILWPIHTASVYCYVGTVDPWHRLLSSSLWDTVSRHIVTWATDLVARLADASTAWTLSALRLLLCSLSLCTILQTVKRKLSFISGPSYKPPGYFLNTHWMAFIHQEGLLKEWLSHRTNKNRYLSENHDSSDGYL